MSSRIIGGGAGSLVGFGFVFATTTSIESSNANLFVVLRGLVDMCAAEFISHSLFSLRFLLLLTRLICSEDPASCHGEGNLLRIVYKIYSRSFKATETLTVT